jgi:hypothetical protein
MTIASKTYVWRLLRSGAGALLLAAGCSGDPALYLGGPPGPAAELQLSTSRFILRAGESRALGAQPRDAVGNPTGDAVTFGSCDASRITVASAGATEQWSQTATVTGVGLGESCVTVSAGAVSDTVRVAVGPGSIVISGPDTVPSGGLGTYELEFYHLDGTPLVPGADFSPPPIVAVDPLLLAISAVDPLTYDAAGQQPGDVTIQTSTTADFGTVTGSMIVTVVPGTFAGTLSAASAAPGVLVTAAKAADGPGFDADSKATLGTTTAFVDGYTASTVSFFVPAIGSTDAATLTLLDMGPTQIAQTVSFTPTKANEDVWSPGNIANDCSIPPEVVDYNANESPGGWVYMVHNRPVQGNRGCVNGGSGYDHWFVYTTGATSETVDILAYWTAVADNDIYVYSTDFSSNPCSGFSGSASDELACAGTELDANTSYYIIFSPWAHASGVTNNQVRITIR